MTAQTHSPTDMMHRRTALPLIGHFSGAGGTVKIHTNSPEVLHAAVEAGLMELTHETQTGSFWEIVAEQSDEAMHESFICRKVQNASTMYLDMGARQWFAFDFETSRGAGFVATFADEDRTSRNCLLYLREVISHAAGVTREEENEGRQR